MPTLQRIQQRTMADGAVHALREAILSGGLAPGQQLRETQLAADLGTSRAPLREALQRLEEEGLVVRIPFRGSYVIEVGAEVAAEIETLRAVLEPFAVESALPRLRQGAGHDEMAAAVTLLEERTAAGDTTGSIDAHLAVHRAAYRAANNAVLFGIWTAWEKQLRLFLAVDHGSFAQLTDVGASHRRLLETIESGDRRDIRRELAAHLGPAAARGRKRLQTLHSEIETA